MRTARFDTSEHLQTPEEMATCLEASIEKADQGAALIAKALRGMAQVARDTGLSLESLNKALSGEKSPGFNTILKVMKALNIRIHAVPSA